MHPIFASRLRLTLYLVAWVGVGIMMGTLLTVTGFRSQPVAMLMGLPTTLVYAFICLSAWWVCRSAPLGGPPLRTLGVLLASAVMASVVWGVFASVWGRLVVASGVFEPQLPPTPPAGPLPPLNVGLGPRDLALFSVAGVPLYLLSASVQYLIIAFESSRAAERRALEAQVVARDAELRALRAQLNPHFLFNSLNSINALVGADPEGARRMCEGLGDFLRRTLALAARDSVALRDEMSLIERYLAIERVRFGERLACRIHVTPEAAGCLVPPLLLQPLVENAVKHGVSERLEGGEVVIQAERDGDALRVTVENPCDAEPAPRPGHGLGLENVRRRLAAVAARDARLDATRSDGVFRVALSLPARETS